MLTNDIRKSILHMMHYSKSSHIGACFSIVEILYVLYFKILNIDPATPFMTERDKFILSKGHASAALYATLAERGFFSKELLNKYYINSGVLPGHLDKSSIPGIEVSTGSLGHGLPIGLGMAIANRLNSNKGNIFVLLGDGECNEGSVWEAIMLAAHLKLNNLTAIVDYNGLQGFGETKDVLNQENLLERWRIFGWESFFVDGHNIDDLTTILKLQVQKPKVVIAKTIKGKGISFMENKLEWHYKSPNDLQFQLALKELEG
ncbi:transketolase [Fodinisporobacter ferrooxydans]|uniref:Transketolase n=1 Tax=Fodinisporobacter ferrooxydans TaxID=2901836 RepID=A0ABY4CPM0_9BACL|nr:transketolase [Alicyclobacillaceae bacterium MYW30-H2]